MKIRGIILIVAMVFVMSAVSGCSKDSNEDYNFVEYKAADGSTIRSLLQELIDDSSDEAFVNAARDILFTYQKRYVDGTSVVNLSDSAKQKARDEVVEHLYELNNSDFDNAPVAVVDATFSEIEATVLLNYVSFFESSTAPNTQAKADSGSSQATVAPTQNMQTGRDIEADISRAFEIVDEARKAITRIGFLRYEREFSHFGLSGYSPLAKQYVLYGGYYLTVGRLVDGKPDGKCIFMEAIKGDVICNGTPETRVKVNADIKPGKMVKGNFSNGKLNGMGYISNDEMTIQAYFVDGELQDGLAILTSDGGMYEGEIKDGKPHGEGRYEYNGTTWQGEFANGEFVCGHMQHEDYSYYGYFENWALQGLGMVVDNLNLSGMYYCDFKDSQIVECIYVYEWTEEEKARIKANRDDFAAHVRNTQAAAAERIYGTGSSSSSNIANIYAESNARVEKFKNDLANSQPPDRIISVPTYGTSAEERSVGNKWSYIIGK